MFVNPHGPYRQIFVKPNRFPERVKALYTRESSISKDIASKASIPSENY